MLPKLAHLTPTCTSSDRRSDSRRVIRFGFDLPDSAGNTRIILLNLSRTGMLLQTQARLAIDESIVIELPEAGMVEARIVRQTGDRFGAEFVSPITRGAVSAILLASPAEPYSPDEDASATAHLPAPRYRPVPDWLLWAVLIVTSVFTALFVYSLSFLQI